jgi:DNA-binding SARP family transcriptional activator/tetratricopeptide (TPR) repeat protein
MFTARATIRPIGWGSVVTWRAVLEVRLLGELRVELNGELIPSPPSQRPWAVFAYLAVSGRPVARAELASRFWPDVLDASARASLRSALWALRRQLGDTLAVGRDHIGLARDPAPLTDVGEFERLAAAGEVEQALALCRGALLEGIEDDWALVARERHRERVTGLLEQRAGSCDEGGDRRGALEWTRRQVELDPFDEATHRRLISRLAQAGDRAGALRAYQAISERLRSQLGVAPSAQTRELVQALRDEESASPPRARGSAPELPRGVLPLVGREDEIEELGWAWALTAAGSGASAILRGEAGIGKTRLAMELRLRAEQSGGRAATCAALDLGGAAPLSLWAELIRELLPDLQAPPADSAWLDDLAVLAAALPSHFGRSGRPSPAVPPELQRTRLFEAVVALLAWAARERPLLLVLEDIHTADGPSLELAAYAARRAAALPVMLLFTRRPRPHNPDCDRLEQALRARGSLAAELDLAPLEAAPVAELARSAARLSQADIGRVVASAEGNALLAVETARSLARGDHEVAANLRASVRAALAPAGPAARELIDVAAVAGRAIEPLELDQLGIPELERACGEALETAILVGDGDRLGFRHSLLRDAVYAELTEPRSRMLHVRWAENLLACERDGAVRRPAEAARHLLLAGRNAPAVQELRRAAADARSVGALEQAAAYLNEAITIAPDRPDLLLELGEIEASRARREEADKAFDRARELLQGGPPLELARALLARARAYHGPLCVPREVLESCRQVLELLELAGVPAPAEHREALAAAAWSEAVAGNADEAERMLASLEAELGGDDLEAYDIGHARAYALMRRGRFDESRAPSVAAAEAAARAGRPDLAWGCWAAAAGAAAATGRYERALEQIDQGRIAIEGTGMTGIEVQALAARSFLLTRIGLLDEARTASESEGRLAAEIDDPELIAMARHDRGLVELEARVFALAAQLLEAALVDGGRISRPSTRLALAEALVGAGELERAAAELRATVLEPVRPSDFPQALVPRLERVQALLALARGDRELATRRLEESIAGWELLVTRAGGAGNMSDVLADLGRPVVGLVEPERELARARADLEALTRPHEQRSTHAVLP